MAAESGNSTLHLHREMRGGGRREAQAEGNRRMTRIERSHESAAMAPGFAARFMVVDGRSGHRVLLAG